MFRIALCACLAVPVAAAAQQSCPTRTDLQTTGIRFIESSPFYQIHREVSPGIIEITLGDDLGLYARNTYAHGVHVIELVNLLENGEDDKESLWIWQYPDAPGDLPAPSAGGTWRADTVNIIYGQPEDELARHVWGTETEFLIGSCSLRAIPVLIRFDAPSYSHEEEFMYFPRPGNCNPDGL